MDDSDITPILLDAATSAYASAAKEGTASDSRVAGFALLSDDSAITFGACALLAPLDSGPVAPDLLFIPDDWNWHADTGTSEAGGIAHELYEACEDYDNDAHWHERFRERFYSLLANALEAFRADAEFGHGPPFLTVWITDSATFRTHAKSWVRRLNDAEIYDRYVVWRDDLEARLADLDTQGQPS